MSASWNTSEAPLVDVAFITLSDYGSTKETSLIPDLTLT